LATTWSTLYPNISGSVPILFSMYIFIYIYTGKYLTLSDLQIWSVICSMVPSYQQTKINQFKLLQLKSPGLPLSSNAQYKVDNSSWDTDRVFWGNFLFCNALHVVISFNKSEIYNSRLFQQAIIRWNRSNFSATTRTKNLKFAPKLVIRHSYIRPVTLRAIFPYI
jgi:hypothetical protein